MELLAFGDQGWGDEILRGAGMTIAVALVSFAFGLIVGMIIAGAKLAGGFVLAGIADAYTTVVRGVPELLVIYLLFFGLEGFIIQLATAFGYGGTIRLDAFTIAALAVGMISGAYSAEVMRGAILAVPRGQMEAARAVGMSPVLRFRRILVPQMLRLALPGLGNVWQLTLKDTALISVTGLAELMRISGVAARSEREPFLFYLIAALVYLVLTSVSQAGFQAAENRAGRGYRRA